MTDIASLAIRIDSTEAGPAASNLDKLTAAGDRAEAAVDRLGNEAEQSAKQVRTASQAAAEMAREAQASAARVTQTAGSSKLAGHHVQNLAFQFNDLAVQIASGANPMTAFVQQGSQIAGVMAQAGIGVGGLVKELGLMATGFLAAHPLLLAAAAAAGLVAAGLGLVTEEINKNSAVTVTWQDTLLGAFDVIKEAISARVTSAFEAMGLDIGQVWEDVKKYTRIAINFIIGASQAVPKVIAATYDKIPAAFGDAFYSAANLAIAALNKLAQMSAAPLNLIIDGFNSAFGTSIPKIVMGGISEIANPYAGAMRSLGSAGAKALVGAFTTDYVGNAASALSDAAQNRARMREAAEKAGKSAGRAGGKAAGAEMAKAAADTFAENLLTEIMGNNAKMIDALQKTLGANLAKKAQAEWDQFIGGIQADRDKITQPISDAAEATAFWNDELSRTMEYLGRIGGLSGGVLDIVAALQGISQGNYTNLPGKAGAIVGLLSQQTGGVDLLDGLGKVLNRAFGRGGTLEDQFDSAFGAGGKFSQTMTSLLQGAGTGAIVGTVMGGSKGAQIGSTIGGAIGQAVGGKVLSMLGSAAGPIGAIAGALLGSVIGGIFKSGPDWATTNLATGKGGGNKAEQKSGVSQAANAFDEAMKKIADAFGATMGEFQTSIGLHNGNWHVSTTGRTGTLRTTRGWQDVTDFGPDAKAALTAAIKDAISDGAFAGLSAGVERLLKGEGDLDAQIQKALSFQGVFDDLAKSKDPQGYELGQLDKWRAGMDKIFAEAGATSDELAQLEELTGLKRKEIVEKYSEEIATSEEKIAQSRALQIDILQMEGNAVAALTYSRMIEKEVVDASLHGLLDRRNALQDEARLTDLQARLYRAQGNEAALLQIERTRELAVAQTEAEQSMLRLIYATEDAAAAAAKAAAAQQVSQSGIAAAQAAVAELRKQEKEMRVELLRLQGKDVEAMALERELRLATLDPYLHAIQKLIWAEEDLIAKREEAAKKVEDARSVLTKAYERESAALRETIDKFKGLGDTLREFRSSLFQGAGLDDFTTLQRRFLQTSALANTGQEDALGKLPDVAKQFLDAARGRASSLVEYQLQVAQVARAVDQAIGAADDVVDYNELQLEALDRSVDGLIEIKEEVASVREAIIDLKAALAEQTGTITQVGTTQIRLQNENNRTLKNVTEGGYAIKTQAVS